MLAVNDTHRRTGTVFLPPQGLLAVASSTPVSVSGTALYNYTEGYGSYLIPAVMIVIIFQTMLMVIAMLTGEEAEQQREGIYSMKARSLKDMLCIVFGKNLRICNAVCCVLHVPVGTAAAYFQHSQYRSGWGHCHYDDSFPACHEFLCACRVPLVYRLRSPTADDSLLFCGLHLFLSGVSYPLELMPWYWQAAHYVFLAPAVLAFVKLNSMGGSLATSRPQMLTLWTQVIIYGAWAVYTTRRVYKRSNIKTGDIEA